MLSIVSGTGKERSSLEARISKVSEESLDIDKFPEIKLDEDGVPRNISFGVILISKNEDGFWVLINQRRHTYDYCSTVIGDRQIRQGFRGIACSNMTKREKKVMIDPDKSFESVWSDVWASSRQNKLKIEAAKYFNLLKTPKVYYMVSTIKKSKAHLPWGFPKGRPSFIDGKSKISTALREFVEETKIKISEKHFISHIPIKDEFLGSDGKIYVSEYYIAFSSNMPNPLKIVNPLTFEKFQVCPESLDVKWVNEKEVDKYLSSSYVVLFERAKMMFLNLSSTSAEASSKLSLYETSLYLGGGIRGDPFRVLEVVSAPLSLTPLPKSFHEFHPEFFSKETDVSTSSSESTVSEERPTFLAHPSTPFPLHLQRPFPSRAFGALSRKTFRR